MKQKMIKKFQRPKRRNQNVKTVRKKQIQKGAEEEGERQEKLLRLKTIRESHSLQFPHILNHHQMNLYQIQMKVWMKVKRILGMMSKNQQLEPVAAPVEAPPMMAPAPVVTREVQA